MARQKGLLPAGAPGWMVTFADLMALMLTFFVLLLSMSTTDVVKYKQALMSITEAFGDPMNGYLTSKASIVGDKGMVDIPKPDVEPQPEMPEPAEDEPLIEATKPDQKVIDATEHLYQKLKGEMEKEINEKSIELNKYEDKIVIRFEEIISFDIARAQLRENFLPILDRVSQTLSDIDGSILVVGHTDDVPITTARFRSNWDLSAARAASVVHRMLSVSQLPPNRIIASGRADSIPLVPNDSRENRAKNRRVEIVITLGDLTQTGHAPLPTTPPTQ
ncbi:flagellar motor protein MotB [Sedimenticola sp.]|uniref:flagellar motor protein MotB n=1 Tax=Sedimenticola sp. TaxID=1940285 RepID=UPI003D118BC2